MQPPWRRSAQTEPAVADPDPIVGTVKIDRRTKDLTSRIMPGDIAVINHDDLDVVAAEALVARRPAAIVNAAPSSTGRYPNEGPLIVIRHGIPLVDHVGERVFDLLKEGTELKVVAGELYIDDALIARGVVQTEETLAVIHAAARASIDDEFARFVQNTLEYIDRDGDLLSNLDELPGLKTKFKDRHVLMVVRGHSYKEDLQLLRQTGYLSEMRPLLVGVDGGADALLDVGFTPDVIIGDFDSVSEKALTSGAELIVHAYRDGRAPGADRLEELGLDYIPLCASGTSEDIAMLLAYEHGAELIVAVGTHSSMVEFLDKGRSGMASTVLVRMKVGTHLVDAKGVSRLYRHNVNARDLTFMVLAAFVVLLVIVFASEPLRLLIRTAWINLTNMIGATGAGAVDSVGAWIT